MDWQPIETAPKDGTVILLWDESGSPITGYWDESLCWCDNARGTWWGFEASHWAPIDPPTRTQGGSDGN